MPDEVVGRGNELAIVERFVERARDGSSALVLEGEAGIGKTTIWRAAVDLATTAGFTVLTSAPARSERGLTLGGLTDLFADVDASVLAGLPDPQRHALEIALLRIEPSGNLPDQRTLSVAVAGLLRELTARSPVLIAIDDAQWLDESSTAIVAYAVRRLPDRALGLLVSVRTGSVEEGAPDLASAVAVEQTERIRLGPLSLAALHQVLAERLGRSFPRLVLVKVEAASAGNPLYALEIGRALPADIDPSNPPVPLPIPDSLGSLMAGRVAALPSPAREAMLLAAAAAEPSIETLGRAMPGFAEALQPAIEVGLVSVDRGSVRFDHPLMAQAVLGLAPATALRRAHAALAATTPSTDARARHLGQAADGPDEAVARALTDAAAAARIRGATLDAATLYLDAGRMTPADQVDRRLERARLAAECLFIDLSEIVQADGILQTAIAEAPPGPARAEALSIRALVRYYHGRTAEAVAMGEQALMEVGDADPMLRARVLGRVSFVVMQLDLERGLDLIDEAIAVLEPGGPLATGDARLDPDLVANALLLRANAELGLIRPTRVADLQRGLRLITRDGRSWEHEGADGNAFGFARLTDDLDHAIELTHELIRAKSGPGGDDPFNLVQLSGLLVFRGRWAEAQRVAEAAMDGYRREGAELHPAWGLRGIALVAAHQGRHEDARRWAEEGLERAMERGDVVISAFHRQILGFVALSAGEWADADAHLTAAAEFATRVGIRHPGRFKLAGDQVEAALAVGDTDRAAAIEAILEEAARVAPTPWVVAVGARASGQLAAARGDLAGAAAAFERAIRDHDRLPMPFERARTLLTKGQLHRRLKEKRLADETLRAALEGFESLGATVWADRTRMELARVGRRPHAPAQLTETERRVAELAAGGLSNRRIAERAFLAPKTVDNVLGRVYQKLDIHSRAELGARMAAGGGVVASDAAGAADTDADEPRPSPGRG
ncbi:MAG TPA: AAA family ATPase [Candidatus Limnocylindrales bacterium]|nr:AAA family ATPase [Candidatus Limnocylindrales bacterium]